MSGVEIQYLLGIYFTVISVSWSEGRVKADAVKVIAGIALVVLAVLGFSLI